MKKSLFLRLLIVTIFISTLSSLGSCSVHVATPRPVVVHKRKPLPPGQAKKIYGDKSAKKYAKKKH
jgi:hypothetical protein